MSYKELTEKERNDIFKKQHCQVKVKLNNGQIFEFNPFRKYEGISSQFNIRWLPLHDFEKPRISYTLCDDVFHMVATEGVESDNIYYLNEANFDIKMMKLNLNIENDRIWTVIKNLSEEETDLEDYDEEYKDQLIEGYKICKEKTYNFKTIEEEEKYFMRDDITAAEEVYYYEFVLKWTKISQGKQFI
jgi:hypothetical protein